MVDASIGGKTGVNHPGGKNLIGAFHQPTLVLMDPDTLATLPKREFRAGMAEVIKYGILGDPDLFEDLEAISDPSCAEGLGEDALINLLERSGAAKARVVAADEKEGGLRAILNYGHTFGHVVENLCGYGTWLHGEAVAIGMVAVGELAVQRGSWSREEADRQRDLIDRGSAHRLADLDPEAVLETLQGDKKVRDGSVRFVMPRAIGAVECSDDITDEEKALSGGAAEPRTDQRFGSSIRPHPHRTVQASGTPRNPADQPSATAPRGVEAPELVAGATEDAEDCEDARPSQRQQSLSLAQPVRSPSRPDLGQQPAGCRCRDGR